MSTSKQNEMIEKFSPVIAKYAEISGKHMTEEGTTVNIPELIINGNKTYLMYSGVGHVTFKVVGDTLREDASSYVGFSYFKFERMGFYESIDDIVDASLSVFKATVRHFF